MADERFLQRWSRLKAAMPAPMQSPLPALSQAAPMPRVAHDLRVPDTPVPYVVMPDAEAPDADVPAVGLGRVNAGLIDVGQVSAATPSLADAALLNATSDYAPFMARGVDASVRRLAMKKLFADPHFNLIDGLDMYMADYNLPDPVSPAMLAALTHARSVLPQPKDCADPADLANSGAPAQLPSSGAKVPAPPPAAPSTSVTDKDSDERTRPDQQ